MGELDTSGMGKFGDSRMGELGGAGMRENEDTGLGELDMCC